ncbi:MAG: hypothetical protein DRQ88_11080 [Epsilonproteobacteria bacterium]|nr:MAG: hypothetical protein DRQ89_05885 [Campylobacterota bacterium]RLA64400.1 MAG: hypothetical protein DRQ88_11080 [Campylobacterota bacterium]
MKITLNLGYILKHLLIILALYSTSLLAAPKYEFKDMAKKCNQKDAQSCFRAGQLAPKGQEIKYYDKGCDLNHENSCITVGNFYYQKKDNEKALKYYDKLCSKNSAKSCFVMGSMHYKTKNFTNAKKAFKKSCNLNFAKACRSVGAMLKSTGEGIASINFFERACYLGDKSACKNLTNFFQQTGDAENFKKFKDLAKNEK